MKTTKLIPGAVAACVVAVGLGLPMTATAASFQPGGTITFRGAIVAPPYDIASRVVDGYQGFHSEASGTAAAASSIEVRFTSAPDASPTAHVAVLVNTDAGTRAPRTLQTRFTDSANRVTRTARAGYAVSGAGGTLSIAHGDAGERAVTVMVSYD